MSLLAGVSGSGAYPRAALPAPVSSATPSSGAGHAGASDPYALPPGQTLRDAAGGKQAQPFDVTMSRLATSVYAGRGAPPDGWKAVSPDDLRAHGIADPDAWRAQYLGGDAETTAQHFNAEIYTDGNGNFVLSYRGTDGTAADWSNNFKQGTGFTTSDGIDKFSGLAANTAVEFQRTFGDAGARSDNLAITGHSQGGGLATVGSIVSGIPAVTFDASGIHPNTWARLGIDPQKARDLAENGGIRAYSLKDDLLTNAQESGPTGLLAPDALGTKVVVAPSGVQDLTTIPRGLDIETGIPDPLTGPIGGALEIAHRIPIPLLAAGGGALGFAIGGPLGALVGGTLGTVVGAAGDLTRAAVSHSPVLLTEAMIQQQPWQPGYRNPTDIGKSLQNLLPDALKDDIARTTHDVAAGIVDVTQTDFKQGQYISGGFKIAGDIGEGVVDTVGDAAKRGADVIAQAVDKRIDGPIGDVLAGVISAGGNGAHVLADAGGRAVEKTADFVGGVVQKSANAVSRAAHWLTGR